MRWRLRPIAVTAALGTVVAAALLSAGASPATAALVICEQYGTAPWQGSSCSAAVETCRAGVETTARRCSCGPA